MSLYEAVFGQQETAGLLLAALGSPDVGRFRDAWVEKGEDGTPRIAVYTRNGGGNSEECWCEANGGAASHGSDTYRSVERDAFEEYAKGLRNAVVLGPEKGYGRPPRPGFVLVRYDEAVCEHPNSAECACTACITNYRLPAHPLYVSGVDDDFDCTYRTFYFRLPDVLAEFLEGTEVRDAVDTSKRWLDAIAELGGGES